MSDHEASQSADPLPDDLVSVLEVIEDQPLAQRAAGYSALHDELSRRLAGDTPSAPADPAA